MKNRGIGSNRNCGNCRSKRFDGRCCTNKKGKYFGTISQMHCREWEKGYEVEKVDGKIVCPLCKRFLDIGTDFLYECTGCGARFLGQLIGKNKVLLIYLNK